MLSVKRAAVEWQNISKVVYMEVDDKPVPISKYFRLAALHHNFIFTRTSFFVIILS